MLKALPPDGLGVWAAARVERRERRRVEEGNFMVVGVREGVSEYCRNESYSSRRLLLGGSCPRTKHVDVK